MGQRKDRFNLENAIGASVIILTILGLASSTWAMQTKLGEEVTLDVDVTVAYGVKMRVKDQSEELLADANADDGNRSFDKGDLVNNRFAATIDMDLKYKNFGLFMRPRAYYDFAYDGSNANDSMTNNNLDIFGGSLTSSDEFSDATQDTHRDKIEILDIFAYGRFDLGQRDLVLRAGRQVVSWGESLYIPGGVGSAMAPLDATAANAPGVELKEIYLPVGQAYTQIDIVRNLSIAGYYQWEWDKWRLDEQGSYFSTSDAIDDAGERLLLGDGITGERASDNDPSDNGQYGIALRYVAEPLNAAEFGFYYINYHQKLPQLISAVDGTQPIYFLRYAENVKLLGASVGTNIGDVNVGADVTYRMDLPVGVETTDPTAWSGSSYADAEILQVQSSAIYSLGNSPVWDNCIFSGEVGFNQVYGLDENTLTDDQFAWGGTVALKFLYYQVFAGLDMDPSITYKFNPSGDSAQAATFAEDEDSITIGVDFTWRNNMKIGLKYTDYLNSAAENPKADRDFIALSVNYTF